MAYILEGSLLEVCTCKAVCPCWVGEDPDNGTCEGTLAWHFDRGNIDGVDVSGLTFGAMAHIPGNVLQGKWKIVAFMDDKASKEQEEAILAAFTGKKGGPLADMAQLIGEVAGLERVKITFEVDKMRGQLRMGDAVAADLEPFRGPEERPTTLHDSTFSNIPGSPAYLGKAPMYRAENATLGVKVDLKGHSAVQGSFRFQS